MSGHRITRLIALTLMVVAATVETVHAGETSMDFARAIQKGDLAEVERLLAAGEDPNGELPLSFTGGPRRPLCLAIHSGHVEIAETLLDAGADPEGEDASHHQPLWWAADEEMASIADRLVELGARIPYCKGTRATEPLVAARQWGALKHLTYFRKQFPDHRTCTDVLFATLPLDDLLLIRELADRGADVNAVGALGLDGEKTTPLAYAISRRRFELAKLLAKLGADPNAPQADRAEPLLVRTVERAKSQEEIRSVALLLAFGADPSRTDGSGCSALIYACQRPDLDLIETLIRGGADPDQFVPGCFHSSCIKALMANSPRGRSIRDYLAVGGTLEGRADGAVPLVEAARTGRLDVAEELLDLRANVDAQDSTGATPLMAAAWAKDLNLVRALLDRGADVWLGDSEGRTALHYAARPRDRDCGDHGVNVVEALLDGGALVDARDQGGRTPLMVAASGCTSQITPLLVRGADPNAQDDHGVTPLHDVCAGGGFRAFRELLAAGARPGVQDDQGVTPMMIAAGLLRQDLMETLRDAGAPSNLVDRNGETAQMKFWTTERRFWEPEKVIDPDLGTELVVPGGFFQGLSESPRSGARRVFSQHAYSHSARFELVVARLARRSDYWTSVVRSCGLSSPETLYPEPPSNLQLSSIPGSPESGGRELIRADLLRGEEVCITYGAELESDGGDGVLVVVAGAPEAAAPETLALLENVLGTVKLGVVKPVQASPEPTDAAEPVEALGRDPGGPRLHSSAMLVLAFAVPLGIVLFLVWRSRQRPRVYVSDRLQPVRQESSPGSAPNRVPSRAPDRSPDRGGGWKARYSLALGAATAIASAIFVVRVAYRLAVWTLALHLGGVGWLFVNAILAVALGMVAWRLWSHSNLAFAVTLLLAMIWGNLFYVPRLRAAADFYGDHHFAFIRIEAMHLTSVILLLIAAVALYSHATVRRFIHSRLTT